MFFNHVEFIDFEQCCVNTTEQTYKQETHSRKRKIQAVHKLISISCNQLIAC